MRNIKRFSFFLIFSALLQSCDLSKYPIDDPAIVKIDTRLLGTWADHKNDLSETYTLARKDDYHYAVTMKSKKDKPLKCVGWLSDVEHKMFLNVYYRDDKDTGYQFYRIIDLNAVKKSISIAVVKDTTMKYLNSTAEIRERIASNINNPGFYGDTGRLYKVK